MAGRIMDKWQCRRAVGLILLACLLLPGLAQANQYVLGMSAAFTGPSRGLGIELYRGSRAYFTHLNENGGVGGQPVVIKTMDDGYQPNPAIQNTISLIEQEDIRCLFNYVGTPTVTRILPLLKGHAGYRKVLFFPFTGAQSQRQMPYSQYVFNLRASYRQELEELVHKFISLGVRRMAVFYQADAYGRSGWDGARRALAEYGLSIVGEATYRRGSSFEESMSAQVRILQRSEPEVVLSIGSYAACAAFVREARDLEFNVPIANVSFVGSENMLSLLQQAGSSNGHDYTTKLINTQVVPSYEDLSLPAVREYREVMDAIRPAAPKQADPYYIPLKYSFTSFEGFLNAKLMGIILEKMHQVPSLGLTGAAESLQNVDIGIDVPVSFSKSRHQGLDKVYFTTVEGGSFVPMVKEHWDACLR